MTQDEMETTVTGTLTDDVMRIYSAWPKHVRKMERDDRFTRVDGDGETWGNYTIDADSFDPLSGLKQRKRVLTDEQRAELAERLVKARGAVGKG